MSKSYRSSLALVTPKTAAGKAAELLESSRKSLGFIPNMYAAMVNSPGLLETYQLGYQRFRETSGFNAAEQEVVLLTISFENGCEYCMAAHSTLADMFSKVPAAVTEAIRAGSEIPDLKLRVLSDFTRHLITTRGRPTEAAARTFIAAGFTEKQILELVLAIAVKTLSNYANHIMGTPVDDKFQSRLWTPPKA